jgi:hypothetical protein
MGAAVFLLKKSLNRENEEHPPYKTLRSQNPAHAHLPKSNKEPQPQTAQHSLPKTPVTLTKEQKDAKLAQLHECAITYEATSLPLIEPALYSEDPEIRTAALNAIIILGAREGGAILRKAANTARNSREAAELLAKAEYVELPSATSLGLITIGKKPNKQSDSLVRSNSPFQGK